jgi:putative Holliday junction resolvase
MTDGVVAGIDYGTVRIGVAISDEARRVAVPLETRRRRGERADGEYFRRLAAERRVTLFVVGLPVYASGQESPKSREAQRFGQWLHEVTGVEVRYFDERYTTAEAESLLQEAGLTSAKRKARRDMLAAQLLLAAFLESGGKAAAPGPLEG